MAPAVPKNLVARLSAATGVEATADAGVPACRKPGVAACVVAAPVPAFRALVLVDPDRPPRTLPPRNEAIPVCMPLPRSPVCTKEPNPAPIPASAGIERPAIVAPRAPVPANAGRPKLNNSGRTMTISRSSIEL